MAGYWGVLPILCAHSLCLEFSFASGCQAKHSFLVACTPHFAEYHTFLSSEWGLKIDAGLCCGLLFLEWIEPAEPQFPTWAD